MIMMSNFNPSFYALVFVGQGPSQIEIESHPGQPSYFHHGEFAFQSLFSGYAILQTPPHNKAFMMGKKSPPIFGLHFCWVGTLPTWNYIQS